jgi:hypothetical protein
MNTYHEDKCIKCDEFIVKRDPNLLDDYDLKALSSAYIEKNIDKFNVVPCTSFAWDWTLAEFRGNYFFDFDKDACKTLYEVYLKSHINIREISNLVFEYLSIQLGMKLCNTLMWKYYIIKLDSNEENTTRSIFIIQVTKLPVSILGCSSRSYGYIVDNTDISILFPNIQIILKIK